MTPARVIAAALLLCAAAYAQPPVNITTPSVLPQATRGSSYFLGFTATGGTGSYIWSEVGVTPPNCPGPLNGLPSGMFTSSGFLAGTPTVSGAFNFCMTAASPPATPDFRQFRLVVNEPPVITTTSLPGGVVGQFYTATIAVSGGTAPLYFYQEGSLPAGLTLNSSTGVISGTPTATGTANPLIAVTDANGAFAERSYTLPVVNPLVISTTSPLAPTTVGAVTFRSISGSGGTGPVYTWSVISGALPTGMNLIGASSGVFASLSGTPTVAGTYNFTAQVQDPPSAVPRLTATRPFQMTVNPPPVISTPSLRPGVIGQPYTQALTASLGTPPYSWAPPDGFGPSFDPGPAERSVVAAIGPVYRIAGLPPGITFNTSTGVLSGTPTATGEFPVTFFVYDSAEVSASRSYTLNVYPVLDITTTSLPPGTLNQAYSIFQLQSTGGAPPITWTGEGLPPGMLVTPTGQVRGTPTEAGNYSVIVRAADAAGQLRTRTLSLQVTGAGLTITTETLPAGTVGSPYSFQLSATGGVSALVWSATGLPSGLTLSQQGLLSGTPTQAGTFQVEVRVTDSTQQTAGRVLPLVINPPGLQITTQSLSPATVGVAYNASVAAAGGTQPYTFSATGLPAGLAISSGGTISGTPTAAGTFSVLFRVTDSVGGQATRTLSLQVNPGALTIVTASLAAGEVGAAYSAQLQAAGGAPPYTWSAQGLPAGMTFSTGGALGGAPTQAGSFNITFTVTDSAAGQASRSLTLVVNPSGLQITTASLAAAVVNVGYSASLAASGGTPPYTWSAQGVPAGLAFSTGGVLSGTPTQTGTFGILFTVTDSAARQASRTLSLLVGSGFQITTTSLPAATLGAPYVANIATTGGTAPVQFTFTGTLPPGLLLDQFNGTISGSPTQSGDFTFIVQARDSLNQTATQAFTITVSGIQILTNTLPNATVNQFYFETITATGGRLPYAWTILGTQAPGLTLDPFTGVLSGTPTTTGIYSLTVRVLDANNTSAQRTLLLTVQPQLSITTASLPNAPVNVPYLQTITATGGTPPYTFSLTGPEVPGLALNAATGVYGGTPTLVGTYTITFVVTDSLSQQATRLLTLIVDSGMSIGPNTLAAASVGIAYSQTFTVTGGTPPYTWQLSGAVPGLSLNSAGVLSGTPTQTGSFDFSIRVTDFTGQAATRAYNLTVAGALRIVTETLPGGAERAAYNQALAATGGTPPYSWQVTGGALPDGLSLGGANGVISGSPTRSGSFDFTVQVTDSAGLRTTRSFNLSIAQGLTIQTAAQLPGGTVGSPYTLIFAASGGTAPFNWVVTAGALPEGLRIESSSGLLTGTPTRAGSTAFAVEVTDATGAKASREFALIIAAPLLRITSVAQLPDGSAGTPYEFSFAATGGVPGYRWSLSGGALPAGLTLGEDGRLSGSPQAAGTYSFTVRVADTAQTATTQAASLRIVLPPLPDPSITGAPVTATPAQQIQPGVRLASAYPVALSGALVLTFAPEAGPDDPAIQFSTGGRSALFTIPAGATTAQFDTAALGVQTGTVAGVITLTAQFRAAGAEPPQSTVVATIRIARAAPVINSVRATRSGNSGQIAIIAYSTAREITSATLRFTAAPGANLSATEFTVQLGTVTGDWYRSAQSAQFGSLLAITIPFTVQGDATAFTAVSVTLTNSVGASQPVSASF